MGIFVWMHHPGCSSQILPLPGSSYCHPVSPFCAYFMAKSFWGPNSVWDRQLCSLCAYNPRATILNWMIDQAGSVMSGTCSGEPLCDKKLQAVNPKPVTLHLLFLHLLITHCLYVTTFLLLLLFCLVARDILQSQTNTICLGQTI